MHNYLRAIGFSNLQNEKDIKEILTEVFHDFDEREVSREGKNKAFVEYTKSFGENMGIKMCGIMDTDGFHQEYYFPYFQGKDISSKEDLIIEPCGKRILCRCLRRCKDRCFGYFLFTECRKI